MHIDFLTKVLKEKPDQPAIVWKDKSVENQWLTDRITYWESYIDDKGLKSGSVVVLEGDFSPNSIALFLALTQKACIIVPIHYSTANKTQVLEIAAVQFILRVNEKDEISLESCDRLADHEFYQLLRKRHTPGLVLFSSGTSGQPKAAVHDFVCLLEKFKQRRKPLNLLNFLLFDHWGGLNTMLHTLSSGGTVLTVEERSPDAICEFIERHKVEILPTSPTFLNLLLLSRANERYDLSSLKLISYGTEPMPISTLNRMRVVFPDVRLQQTYGLIELGVLRSKSKSSDSLWMKIGGEGFETRVVEGLLEIKAKSAMLGYLNEPSPFSEDGWYMTGDSVETDGEYFKILGRKSEVINVGGEKVYPAEVESTILEIDNVADATVYGEKNMITGNIVCANVGLVEDEDEDKFVTRLKTHCGSILKPFKVPIKVNIIQDMAPSVRFKKQR